MTRKNIVFTRVKTAKIQESQIPDVTGHDVLVRMEYTVVSGGTERAGIMGMPNAGGNNFPKKAGYCGVGRVERVGGDVSSFSVGDRVLVYHGVHSNYNIVAETHDGIVGFAQLTKVEDDCRAILDLISAKKLRVRPIVSRVVAPEEASEIYRQLCDDPAFPIGTVFDWRGK
jgi:threonine dehydrogenase-like Zn-dependent dehydrogenase